MLTTLNAEASKLGYKPREVQVNAINWLTNVWDSPNKCKVLSSPVGSGKSLVAYTIAKHLAKEGKTCAIITPQNILIDQYLREFKDINYFKGKKHYACPLTQTTCEDGLNIATITKKPCEGCPYISAKERCYHENISLFNPMSYFVLSKLRRVEGGYELLYNPDTIIIDEVQSLPSMLRDLLTIKIWETDIKWKSGVSSSIPSLVNLFEKYLNKLSGYIRNKNLEVKEKARIIQSQKRIDLITTQLRENSSYFICEESMLEYRGSLQNCLHVRPKYVPPAISKQFFKLASHIILMTGTAFPHIWQELGFNKVDYFELPSPIPKENRSIFSLNSVSIGYQENKEERSKIVKQVANQISYIVDKLHPKDSGVVLVPYSLAQDLKDYLTSSYYIHMDKKTKSDKINNFISKDKRQIGIFSGSFEGLSLDDDISRFTIIPKVPFPSLSDKVIQARKLENEMSYYLDAMTMIIQGSGRSTRSEIDYSRIYILDTNFSFLFARTRSHLPQSFKESLIFKNKDFFNENC